MINTYIQNAIRYCTVLYVIHSFLYGGNVLNGVSVANDARLMLGKPYVWGGESKAGMDCSGLVRLIYNKYGYSIPRTASNQLTNTVSCPTFNLLSDGEIGDTLYFKNKEEKIHHVGIITGFDENGKIIMTHAKGKEYGVIEEPISANYLKEFAGLKKFYNCTSALSQKVTEEEVAKVITFLAREHAVDTSMLYTLISIESNFEPYVITIETTPKTATFLKALKDVGLKVVTGGVTYHSKQAIVNIYPEDITMAQYIATSLKQNKYDFDLGLMQIHSSNFTLEETTNLFYPKNNIEKGLKILTHCLKTFRTQNNQIECYNRGAGNLKKARRKGKISYPYYKRFISHYNRYFKE